MVWGLSNALDSWTFGDCGGGGVVSPALNFQAQFADAVESGEKRQTIRAMRKDGRDPKVGDTLYLFTGMRTKACRKLGEARCTFTCDIRISAASVSTRPPCPGDVHSMARDDGFESFAGMRAWFNRTHGLPFEGKLYRWDAPTAPPPEAAGKGAGEGQP